MSNVNPGGSRNKFGGRVFGADKIKRAIQSQRPDHTAGADNSIADRPHAHSREIARRLKQKAKNK